MKTYIFEGINGEVGRVNANSIDEAIKLFKKSYPTRYYAFVAEAGKN